MQHVKNSLSYKKNVIPIDEHFLLDDRLLREIKELGESISLDDDDEHDWD